MFKNQTNRYLILVVTLLFILTSCSGTADYSIDLPGDYSVVRTSAHQVNISPKEDENIWGSDVIPPKVVEVAWDGNYILAKQYGLIDDPDSSDGYQIPDIDDVHFWIFNYKLGEVYGPLDEENFSRKKNELGISKNVILKEIEDIQ